MSKATIVKCIVCGIEHLGTQQQQQPQNLHISPTQTWVDNLWFPVLMFCFNTRNQQVRTEDDRCWQALAGVHDDSWRRILDLWRLPVQLSLCAVLLWGTGNTHNYHVNEGAAVCRGQLTLWHRADRPSRGFTGLPWTRRAQGRGRGGGAEAYWIQLATRTHWWIHANTMQIEGRLWHLLFQLWSRQMFENTDVRSATNHPKLKTQARIKGFYGKEHVFLCNHGQLTDVSQR